MTKEERALKSELRAESKTLAREERAMKGWDKPGPKKSRKNDYDY